MVKADGSVLVHADAGGYKPLNWMTPPTVVEEDDGAIVVRKLKGEDRVEITLHEVVSDVDHTMDEDAARLEKNGVERDLQALLADLPERCGEGFRLVRREWPTDIVVLCLVWGRVWAPAGEPFLRLGLSTRGGIMAVMAVDAGAPVAVKERLEAFAGEVLAAAMNRPVQLVNGGLYGAPVHSVVKSSG